MERSLDPCNALAAELALEPLADGSFMGKVEGFPVALRFIEAEGGGFLLFEVRHWLNAGSPQLKGISYDAESERLLEEKKIEIEFDDRRAWLTIYDATQAIESGLAARTLIAVLQAFVKAGLIGDPDLCHYCQKTKVESVTCIDGKVVQICPACLEERKKRVTKAATTAEAIPIFLMTPAAALAGAFLWAGFWAGHQLFFERLNAKSIWLPGGILVVMFVGFIVGGPIGWIIKQNRKRGRAISVAAARLFAAAAVIGGEVLYIAWLIYHQYNVFSISVALHVMPKYYLHNDPLFLLFKIVNALAALGAAEIIAKPKEATLEL